MPVDKNHFSEVNLDLTVRFLEKVQGRSLYQVQNDSGEAPIFVGTKDECGRYLKILHEKIHKHLNRKRLTRNLTKRIYRADFSDYRRAGA